MNQLEFEKVTMKWAFDFLKHYGIIPEDCRLMIKRPPFPYKDEWDEVPDEDWVPEWIDDEE